jgi:hypothetical protein
MNWKWCGRKWHEPGAIRKWHEPGAIRKTYQHMKTKILSVILSTILMI